MTLLAAADERDEAEWVVRELERRSAAGDWGYGDMAVLYRTNAQSRALEEAFRRAGVPYRLVGAISFYERREVKDLLAYLRLVANPADDEAFLRAVGVPRRGLGETSLATLGRHGAAVEQAAARHGRASPTGSPTCGPTCARRSATSPRSSTALAERAAGCRRPTCWSRSSAPSTTRRCCTPKGPRAPTGGRTCASWWPAPPTGRRRSPRRPSGTPLERFLAEAALLSSADTVVGNEEGVTLMTLHTAKGLEWPVVVLTGLEHGLFPLARAEEQPDGLEEERRLCYVGLTRAKDKLYLTWARARRRGGELRPGHAVALSPGAAARRSWRSGGRRRSGRRTGGRAGGRADAADAGGAVGERAGRHAARPAVRPAGPAARGGLAGHAALRQGRAGPAPPVRQRDDPGLTGTGRDLKVSVAFDDEEVGVKQLLVAYAGLEREWESA